jgi:hypothetical protein
LLGFSVVVLLVSSYHPSSSFSVTALALKFVKLSKSFTILGVEACPTNEYVTMNGSSALLSSPTNSIASPLKGVLTIANCSVLDCSRKCCAVERIYLNLFL